MAGKGSGVRGQARAQSPNNTASLVPGENAGKAATPAKASKPRVIGDPSTRNKQGAPIGASGGVRVENEPGFQSARKQALAEGPVDRDRKVQATRTGYYEHLIRRPGDVFILRKGTVRGSWMRFVDEGTRTSTSTANQEIARQHDQTLGARVQGGARSNAGADPIGATADDDLEE